MGFQMRKVSKTDRNVLGAYIYINVGIYGNICAWLFFSYCPENGRAHFRVLPFLLDVGNVNDPMARAGNLHGAIG